MFALLFCFLHQLGQVQIRRRLGVPEYPDEGRLLIKVYRFMCATLQSPIRLSLILRIRMLVGGLSLMRFSYLPNFISVCRIA